MSTYLNGVKISYSDRDIYGHIDAIISIFKDRLDDVDYNIISMDDEPWGVRVWVESLKKFVEEIREMTEEEWKEMLDYDLDDSDYFDREEFHDYLLSLVEDAEENHERLIYIFMY